MSLVTRMDSTLVRRPGAPPPAGVQREVQRPDFGVRERDPRDDGPRWQLLFKVIEPGDDFDRVAGGAGRPEVSAHGRMERLLRQTGVPAGLLSTAPCT